ncbi:hypothetical protein QT971_13070 [Microcoleus sp. herbarium19]|uniref:DUF6602 domain-containing protein n=1 Tax=unclassified Microcoleus TaxID=2642155 RepID=UPI002FCFEB6B
MLKDHVGAVENHLLSISKIPANAGHTLHKGTPREAFIREFLQTHLSERVAIGTGEIIDAHSRAGGSRNQFDIVIYKRNYPKLDFGGGISGFLAESVVATIEVKSLLDKNAIRQSIEAARNAKKLQRNLVSSFSAGYIPPGILNYVVAYDGPVNIETVYKWIPEIHIEKNIVPPKLNPDVKTRISTPSSSIDGVFLLGKGFIYFDNVPFGFFNEDVRTKFPDTQWVIGSSLDGNLLLLFVFLTQAASGVEGAWLNPVPYLSTFTVQDLKCAPFPSLNPDPLISIVENFTSSNDIRL